MIPVSKKTNGLTKMARGYDTKFSVQNHSNNVICLSYTHDRARKYGDKMVYKTFGYTEDECLSKMIHRLNAENKEAAARFSKGVRLSYKDASSFGVDKQTPAITRCKVKATGQECIIINGTKYIASVLDDSQIEVVGAENRDYIIMKSVTESAKIDSIMKHRFSLKDCIEVPINNVPTVFIVENVREYDKYTDVYFVARNAIAESDADKLEECLDRIETQMPGEFVSKMKDIEHRSTDGISFVRRVSILSTGNLNYGTDDRCRKCCGEDDVPFDGMIRCVDRSKYLLTNVDGRARRQPTSYFVWPRYSNSGTLGMHIVNDVGTVRPDSKNKEYSEKRGIVPMFCLRIVK